MRRRRGWVEERGGDGMQDKVGRGEGGGSAGERKWCKMRCWTSGGDESKDDGGFAGTWGEVDAGWQKVWWRRVKLVIVEGSQGKDTMDGEMKRGGRGSESWGDMRLPQENTWEEIFSVQAHGLGSPNTQCLLFLFLERYTTRRLHHLPMCLPMLLVSSAASFCSNALPGWGCKWEVCLSTNPLLNVKSCCARCLIPKVCTPRLKCLSIL